LVIHDQPSPSTTSYVLMWFTKSLIGPIARDVSMGGVVTKERAIIRAQYLDLIYSKTCTLYYLILDAPLPSTNPTPTP
jgi:hypothetical protein